MTVLTATAFFALGCLLPQQPTSPPTGVRVITYNVHAWGPVAAAEAGRQRARQMASRGQLLQRLALELQLYEPDIIALQEAHSEARVKELAALMSMDYAYFPGGWRGKGWREGISGAILSRLKIVERENRPSIDPAIPADKLFSRCLGRVVVQHGKQQLAVYCAHMLPSWKETTHIREAEIRALSVATQKDIEAGRSVIVMGDMNHDPGSPEYRLWAERGLVDTAAAVAAGQTQPQLTCPSLQPTERIDYVFVAGPLRERLRTARVLQTGAFGVVPKDPASYALSDHLPVLAVFK